LIRIRWVKPLQVRQIREYESEAKIMALNGKNKQMIFHALLNAHNRRASSKDIALKHRILVQKGKIIFSYKNSHSQSI
jgi:hypothetical protein